MVLSAAAREYKHAIKLHCMVRKIQPMEGNVTVHLEWYRGRRSGDLDKRIGICLDALQGFAYMNDAQIVGLTAYRYEDKANPRLLVRVEQGLAPPCPYVRTSDEGTSYCALAQGEARPE